MSDVSGNPAGQSVGGVVRGEHGAGVQGGVSEYDRVKDALANIMGGRW